MKYLCGCEDKPFFRTERVPGKDYDTNVIRDSEGFEVCPEHGMREVGWRGQRGHIVQTKNGPRIDYMVEYGGGKELKLKEIEEDKRFNDDPQEFYAKLVAERKAQRAGRNGHDK
jgi:hypothetical protein